MFKFKIGCTDDCCDMAKMQVTIEQYKNQIEYLQERNDNLNAGLAGYDVLKKELEGCKKANKDLGKELDRVRDEHRYCENEMTSLRQFCTSARQQLAEAVFNYENIIARMRKKK